MDNKKIARELLRIADKLDGGYKLRVITMDDVMNDTRDDDLKVVYEGSLDDINDYAKNKLRLLWKNSRKQLFGGYWYDKKNGEAYLITK